MKKIIKFLLVSISAMMILSVQYAVFAEDSGYADLSFSLASRSYSSKGVKAPLKYPPVIKEDTLMVPAIELLKGLGYQVTLNQENFSIIAVRGDDKMEFQLNNGQAVVNGETRNMPVPLMFVKKGLYLPARFVAVNSGAGVVWDQSRKQITITRIGDFNTGEVLLLEKLKDGKNVLIYDGHKMKKISINNQDILKSYYFKGNVLLGIGQKGKNPTSLALCGDEDYSTLLENFEVNGTFEFNDNLIIYGYDQGNKVSRVYRFDGNNLSLVANNFNVEKYVLFGNKLIVSQYDSSRKYSLVMFDGSTWQPTILSSGFVLKDSAELDGSLFMTGAFQEGTKKPLAVYDPRVAGPYGFSIVNNDIDVDLQNAEAYGGYLYAVSKDSIKVIGKNGNYNLLFPFDSKSYIKYDANSIKLYNGKLYFGITGTRFTDLQGNSVPKPEGIGNIPPFVFEFTNQWTTKKIVDNFSVSKLIVQSGKLLILGKEKADSDSAMYIFDGLKTVKAVDVYALNKTISMNGNLLTDVKDKDRTTDKSQNTILYYDNVNISNVISGLRVNQWAVLGDALIMAGSDKAEKTDKLYSYTDSLNEIEGNYKVKNWSNFGDVLFVNGYDAENKTYNVLRFVDENENDLGMNIEIIKMIKVKANNYLVYATNKEKGNPLYGKKVLYLYNDTTKEFEEMKVGINLADMLYLE